jgi:hypothetical protein
MLCNNVDKKNKSKKAEKNNIVGLDTNLYLLKADSTLYKLRRNRLH